MNIDQAYRFEMHPAINQRQYQEIKRLEVRCMAHECLQFKLEADFKLAQESDTSLVMTEFLCYNNQEELIGYLGICSFSSETLEIHGMVHPDYRRQGIFSSLYQLAHTESKKRAAKQLLLLCDKQSVSGLAFIMKQSPTYHHTEYEMCLNPTRLPNNTSSRLNIQADNRTASVYVGKQATQVIGQVRLEVLPDQGGIYGLEVLPIYRGQGYGRELLLFAANTLLSFGCKRIVLQVDTTNDTARHLYESAGFKEQVSMIYYAVSLTLAPDLA